MNYKIDPPIPYFENDNGKKLKKLYDEFKFEEAEKVDAVNIKRAPYWKAKAYFNMGDYKTCLVEV